MIVVSLLTGSFSALCGTDNGKASAEAYYCATDQCYDKCCKSKHIISPFVVVVSFVSLLLKRIIRPSSLQNACRTKYFLLNPSTDGREIPSRSVIHNVLITIKGLKYNEYSGFFDNVITLDELFV